MSTLKVETRKEKGKYAAFALREAGFLPGVIYGKDLAANINVRIPARDLEQAIHRGERILDLDIDGAVRKVIIAEVQHGVFAHEVLHADFRAISETDRIRVDVDIELHGEAPGVHQGGIIDQSQFSVEIECLPKDLPEKIQLNVSALQIGDVCYVRDLPDMPGVKYLTPAAVAVVTCHLPAGEAEPAAAGEGEDEAGKEPEVIGEKEREAKRSKEGD